MDGKIGRRNAEISSPGFEWVAATFVALIERKIRHYFGRDELFFVQRQARLPVHTSPGAGVEVDLVQGVPVAEAGVERDGFDRVGVPVHDVLRPTVAELLVGQGVLVEVAFAWGAQLR